MPDLSHLTDEERQTIMMVMNRHREEERAEIQMIKSGKNMKKYFILEKKLEKIEALFFEKMFYRFRNKKN